MKEIAQKLFHGQLNLSNLNQLNEEPLKENFEESNDFISDSFVYCWFLEYPEVEQVLLAIRKAKSVQYSAEAISDTLIKVTAKGSLDDQEFLQLSKKIGLPEPIFRYYWTPWEKTCEFQLQTPIVKQGVIELNTENLIVISFKQMKNTQITF